MSGNVTVLRPSGNVAWIPDRSLDAAISAICSDASFGEIRAGLLTPAVRAEIEARRKALEDLLRPATWVERCAVLATFEDEMVSKEQKDPRMKMAHLQQRADDLEGTPIFALKAAARAFRNGDIGDCKFVPTVAQLRRKALEIAAADQRELSRLTAIFRAKIDVDRKLPDAARRQELAAQMRKGFFESRVETPAADPAAEEAAKRMREVEARAQRQRGQAVSLSDAARSAIGAVEAAPPASERSAEAAIEGEVSG